MALSQHEQQVPTSVTVWTAHLGRVVDGARDRPIMGGNYRFEPLRNPGRNRRATIWTTPETDDPGPLLGRQGTASMMAMWVWGVMRRGSIVTVDADRYSDLVTAADAVVINWWVPARLDFDDAQTRLGLLFATGDEARACARLVDAETVVSVTTTMFNASGEETDNVQVTDLEGNVLASASLSAYFGTRQPTELKPLIPPLPRVKKQPGNKSKAPQRRSRRTSS